MPPFKVRIQCQDCRWKFSGFNISATDKAIRHADKHQHSVDIWRDPGEKMTTITRKPRPEDWLS